MKSIQWMKLALCVAMNVGLSTAALASCGDSLSALAAQANSFRSESRVQQSVHTDSAATNDNANNASIVGLWHISFKVGDHQIQEAYQIWNTGGTEVHNPNVDPRTGNVCLGAWKQTSDRTFKLTHRVWIYDASGNFGGTIQLNETLTLDDKGSTHSGTFTLRFYDPSGNFQFEVPGNVTGERISVE